LFGKIKEFLLLFKIFVRVFVNESLNILAGFLRDPSRFLGVGFLGDF